MKKLAILLVILFCAMAFAQSDEPPKIAVYVTGDLGESESRALETEMLNALVKSGRYIAVERSEAFVAEIDREMVTQHGGSVDDDQISVLGKRFGVQYICVADVAAVFDAHQMSVRILDVETTQIMFAGRSDGMLNSVGALMVISNAVVNNMFGGTDETKAPETVKEPELVSTVDPEPAMAADHPYMIRTVDLGFDGFTPKQLFWAAGLNFVIPGSGSLIVQQDYIGTAVGGGIGITGLYIAIQAIRRLIIYEPYGNNCWSEDNGPFYCYRSDDDFRSGSDDRVSEKEIISQYIRFGIGMGIWGTGAIYSVFRSWSYKKPVPKATANNNSSRNLNFAVIPDVNGGLKAYTLYSVEF